MKKTYTFIYYSVLKTKSSKTNVNNKKLQLLKTYNKCSKALNCYKLSPSNEVVNKIIKYADL